MNADVYGALLLQEFTSNQCRLSAKWPLTLASVQPTWAVSLIMGCYHLYTPLPFIVINHPKDDTYFTITWSVSGWVDLGVAIRVCSPMVKAVYCSDSCDKEQRGCLLWNSMLGSHAPQPRVTAKPVQLWYLVYNRCDCLGLCETIKLNIWWRTRQRLNHKQRNFARRCFWYKFR